MRISAQGFKADSQLVTTVIGGDCVTSRKVQKLNLNEIIG